MITEQKYIKALEARIREQASTISILKQVIKLYQQQPQKPQNKPVGKAQKEAPEQSESLQNQLERSKMIKDKLSEY